MNRIRHTLLAMAAAFLFASFTVAQVTPAVPTYNSRAGAAFTLYLDFSGFNYTGTWGGATPGYVAPYNNNLTGTFSAAEQANIKNIWARVAEAYTPFSNINVTTLDPAVAAGQAGSFLARQNYYDATPRVIHTVIGHETGGFFSGAGGVSFVNTWNTASGSGGHTNWVFSNRTGSNHNVHTATVHENGHAAGLSHQGDYTTGGQVNDYSTNNGSGTLAPFMGVGYSASRNTWRVGPTGFTAGNPVIHNDPLRIIQRNTSGGGVGFFNDGIGQTIATATNVAYLDGAGTIDFNVSRGVIVPTSTTNPNPIGSGNYTLGVYRFTTVGGNQSITVNSGNQFITAGVADPDATLDATLRILDAGGAQLAISATASLSETINIALAAGTYYIEVSSAGGKQGSLGPTGTWVASQYYDMGSYFLTGLIAVPEPGTIALFGVVVAGLGIGLYRRIRIQRLAAKNEFVAFRR